MGYLDVNLDLSEQNKRFLIFWSVYKKIQKIQMSLSRTLSTMLAYYNVQITYIFYIYIYIYIYILIYIYKNREILKLGYNKEHSIIHLKDILKLTAIIAGQLSS